MTETSVQEQLYFSVQAEILLILASGMPKDALDIFQELKSALTKQANAKAAEKAAEVQASLPPFTRARYVLECKVGFAFNYDEVVKELTMLVSAGKLRRMDGASEPVYALA